MSKFKTWDSQILLEAATTGLQIRSKIEEMCIKHRIPPDDLPNSLIPTNNLYTLVCAYEAAYNALMEHELLTSGNQKISKNVH